MTTALATTVPGAEASTGVDASTEPSGGTTAGDHGRRSRSALFLIPLIAAGFAVVLWGGYTQDWAWTGVTESQTLWDWLQLLLVPIAFATLPIWLRQRTVIGRDRKVLMGAAVTAFAGFVAAGYLLPLPWTGFPGNTLWDWLTLLLLPVSIVSIRFLRAERRLGPVHYVAAVALITTLAVIVCCGYLMPWDWTGFAGNTLFDWFKLLVLPIVFPTVIVPAAAGWLTRSATPRAG